MDQRTTQLKKVNKQLRREVTEQYQAEAALRNSETKYRSIFENAVEGIFQITAEGHYISANPALARIYGYDSPEELIESFQSSPRQLYVNPGRRAEFVNLMQENGAISKFESPIYRKDGSIIWISENARTVQDANGTLLYYEGFVQDITERKWAEERVCLLQTMMLKIAEAPDFDSALSAVIRTVCNTKGWNYGEAWIPDLDGAVLRCSSAWHGNPDEPTGDSLTALEKFREFSEALTFTPGRGIPGRVWLSRQPEWQPDVSQTAEPICVRASIARDCGLKTSLGIPIIANINPSAGDEKVLAILVFFRFESCEEDKQLVELVSAVAAQLGSFLGRKAAEEAMRHAEEKYRSIFENATEGIFQSTPEGRFLSANPALARIHGYESPMEMITQLTDITQQLYVDPNRRTEFMETMHQHHAVSEFESQVYRRDGSIIWISVNARVVRDASGNILYYEGFVQDITERKQAQEALQQASHRLQAVLDAVPGFISWIGSDLRYQGVNQRLAASFGLTPETFVGQEVGFQSLTHEFPEFMRDFFVSPEESVSQIIDTEVEGVRRSHLVVAEKYQQGTAAVLVGIDISERQQVQQALQLSEERYTLAVSAGKVGVLDWNLETNEIYLAPNLKAMLGYQEEEIKNTLWAWRQLLYPEDRERVIGAARDYLVGLKPQFEIEHRMRHKDGTLRWFLARGTAIRDETGKLHRMAMSETDITERKKAEEALHIQQLFLWNVIDMNPNLIFAKDWEGRFTLANRAVAELYGTSVKELIGNTEADFNPNSAEVERFLKDDREVMSNWQEKIIPEETITDVAGNMRCFQTIKKPLISVYGEPCQVLGVSTDITERKRLEEELRKAIKTEKELGDLKSRFVSMTSHEFRTPLSTILSSAELLERYGSKWDEQKKLKHLHRIQASVKNMTQLLNDVLLIGKAEAGKLEFNPAPLDLSRFCADLVEEFQLSAARQHRLQFIRPSATQRKGLVLLDEKLLRQILSNLLSNAIKYSSPGSTVHFELAYQDNKAVFQIRDEGIGIPLADQQRLFQSFHRADNVGAIPGTGLGLAIVKKCVDTQGGDISVTSELGVGTKFTVKLPLRY